jgi:hypothetical protein
MASEWTAEGIYDVKITVAGEMTWLIGLRDSFEQRMSQVPDKLVELPSLGTVRVEDDIALALSWVDVAAENAWAAIAKVADITSRVLPEVHGQAVDMRITSTIQDPDAERRRPLDTDERITSVDREARLALAMSAEAQATNASEAENDAQRLADEALTTPLGRELVDRIGAGWRQQHPADEPDPLKGAMVLVRDRMLWAARWALTSAALYELDLEITPKTVAMLGGSRCMGWPDAPEPA